MFTEVAISSFVKECVDVPTFLDYCKNCSNYNKRWSCPPYSFSAESFWSQYSSILLFAEKIYTPKEFLNKVFTKEQITQITNEILSPAKKKTLKHILDCEKKIQGSVALSAGCCDACTTCMRELRQPCLHPELMRYSIESLGGNVSKALELYFKENILWIEEGKMPEYFFLLSGLLKK